VEPPDPTKESGTGLRLDSPVGRWALSACVLGSAVAMLTGTVVNVALPEIGRDLGADVAGLQWILNGYMITLASLILVGGSLGDRYGRRRVFIIGVAWFAVASVACAVAPDIDTLVAARVMQGIGGALLTPGSLAIIEASFVRTDRARAIGAWSALGAVAAAIGPLLGGWLVNVSSWRAVFLLNLPIAVAVVLIGTRFVPESKDESVDGRLDWAGAVSAVVALGGLTYALIEVPGSGWSPTTTAAAVMGAVGAVVFILAETRGASPMMPLEVFGNRQFTAANLVTFVVYASLSAVFFLLIVQLQTVVGYSPLQAGAALLPITGLMLLLSTRSGALATRIGPRRQLTIGPLLMAAAMMLMRGIGPGSDYLTDVLPAVTLFGLGLAALVAPVTATVLAAADEAHAGVASGVNNAVSRTAGLIAVAAIPPLAGLTGDAFTDSSAFNAGFGTAMVLAAGLAVAGGVIAWLMISDDILVADDTPDGAGPDEPCWTCPTDGAPLRPVVASRS
jgi:EmrB/QacA subfamily drug resistance transporter